MLSTIVEQSQLFCGFQGLGDFFLEFVVRNGFVECLEISLCAMNANRADGIFASHLCGIFVFHDIGKNGDEILCIKLFGQCSPFVFGGFFERADNCPAR